MAPGTGTTTSRRPNWRAEVLLAAFCGCCRNAANEEREIHMLILRTTDHRIAPKGRCDGAKED